MIKSTPGSEVCVQGVGKSRWAEIESIAGKISCTTLTSEQARVKQLDRENAELRRANEILREATAFFAQAELNRRERDDRAVDVE